MGDIISFKQFTYDEAAAYRGYERVMFGELLDDVIDDLLTAEYDSEQLDKMLKDHKKKLSHKSLFGAYLSNPEFVKTLGEPSDLSDEEREEIAALEEAYRKSFERGK